MFKKRFKMITFINSYTYYFFYSKKNIFSKWKVYYVANDEVDRDRKKNELGIV